MRYVPEPVGDITDFFDNEDKEDRIARRLAGGMVSEESSEQPVVAAHETPSANTYPDPGMVSGEIPERKLAELPSDGHVDHETPGSGLPKPGQQCPTCERRVPHPRKQSSPTTKNISYRVPLDEIEAHEEVIEAAAHYIGVYERPHWRFWLVNYALAALMLDPDNQGIAQRGEIASQ